MFSSTQLISYVFADPNDEYRDSDLVTWNFPQYLWKSLHRDGFDAVYFLRSSADGCCFTVHTFSDQACDPYTPPLLGSPKKKFGDWLLRQLCLKDRRAAIVCPLNDFCNILSHPDWHSLATNIANAANRTGIFVLTASPYAEDSREALLRKDSVFDWLKETAVTDSRGSNRCIYSDLREKKPNHYLCLNAFTKERIDALLLHLCAEMPERSMYPPQRRALADLLAARLQQLPLPGMPADSGSVLYLSYRTLYRELRRREVWDSLEQMSCRPCTVQAPPILRSPDCCAGECLTLRLPDWAQERIDSERYLKDIRKLLCAPINSPEDQALTEAAGDFLFLLKHLEEGDEETCALLLDALRFCVKWLHICPEDRNYEKVLRFPKALRTCIDESTVCFRTERSLALQEANPPASAQEWIALTTSRERLNEKKEKLRSFTSLLRSNIITQEFESSTDSNALVEVLIREMQNTSSETFVL